MRRLAALTLLLAAAPVAPAHAAATTTTWVVERVRDDAGPLTIRGGAGAGDGEYAFAAVATTTVDAKGQFDSAQGVLFFGVAPDTQASTTTPVGDLACRDVPAASEICAGQASGGVVVFAAWWDAPGFDLAFVVLHGSDKTIDLGERGSRGWRARRWTAPVRVVDEGDLARTAGAFAMGAAVFGRSEAPGGVAGSLAIGHIPCKHLSSPGYGTGAATLTGGEKDVLATCADFSPPAAYAFGGTEWVLDGAVTGVSDSPARLVVIDRKAVRGRR